MIVLNYLSSIGYIAQVNPDKYGPDLIARKFEDTYFVEVEVKHAWIGEFFPYDTIQLPERKTKFTNLEYDTIFCLLNSQKTKAILIHQSKILSSELKSMPNKYMDEEQFYSIPISECAIIDI